MRAEDLLKSADLDGALKALTDQVRKDPANPQLRTFLFQLMVVMGRWDRALTQLTVVAEMDSQALPMAQAYREAIQCEMLRAEVFAGKRSPLVFGDPNEWIALLIQALQQTASGHVAESQDLRNQAFEAAPATAGRLDEQAFTWIADADSRLGPVMEAVVNGRYYWIPVQNIASIDIEEPADLRDNVWMPAHFTWPNGGDVVAFIPTRYPGSEASEDAAIALARKTDWRDLGADLFVGLGQRMLATDTGDFALMDVRKIEFDQPEAA